MSFLARAKLDGKTFYDMGFIFLQESQRPGLPNTRDRIVTIPGRQGDLDFGATLSSRSFELRLSPRARNSYDLQVHISALMQTLVDPYGRPKTVPLVFPETPDRVYMVRYAGSLPIDRIVGPGAFSLPLTAFDPYAYSVQSTGDDIYLDSDILLDSDIPLDFSPYTYPVTGPTTIQVNHWGSAAISPVIEIVGSFTTFSVAANGQTLVYSEAFTGSKLSIDCAKMTAKFGSVNKLGKCSGNFPELLPGVNNVQIAGTGLNCSVSFVFRPRWL